MDVQVQEITNFDPPCSTEESSTTDFDIQSRYSATISLNYLVIKSRVSSL